MFPDYVFLMTMIKSTNQSTKGRNFVAEHNKENSCGEITTNHITTSLYIDVNINFLLKNNLTIEWISTKKQA